MALLLLTGCMQGPRMVQASRAAYNEVVQSTSQEELLLNLVRLRYLEAPEFLDVASISTQFEVTAAAGVGADLGQDAGATSRLARPAIGYSFSERPTITFAPRHDAEFLRHLLEPIELEDPVLLVDYGWGLGRVLQVTVEQIGPWWNRTDREQIETSGREFLRCALLMDDLHRRDLLRLRIISEKEPLAAPLLAGAVTPAEILAAAQQGLAFQPADDPATLVLTRERRRIVLQFRDAALSEASYRELVELLGLPPGRLVVDVDPEGQELRPDSGTLAIRTRSVLEAMAHLSVGVAAPPEHLDRGWLGPDSAHRGLRVRSDRQRPETRLAVPYRGYWFFLDDGDLESRRTLVVLTSLMRLRVGAGGGQALPLLTLPVGGS